MKDEITTIGLSPDTKDRLERIKVHPNQSFDEILGKILDFVEKNEKFTNK